VYPGCGYDNNWDLGLSEGEPGFDHVALRLGNTAELDEYDVEDEVVEDAYERVLKTLAEQADLNGGGHDE